MHMIKFFLAAAAGRHVANVAHVVISLTNRAYWRTQPDYLRQHTIMPISLEVRLELCATAESNSNSSVVKSMHMIKFFLAAAAGRHVADVVHMVIIFNQ